MSGYLERIDSRNQVADLYGAVRRSAHLVKPGDVAPPANILDVEVTAGERPI